MSRSSSQDDRQPLLVRAAEGDRAAVDACLERLGPRVAALVRRFGFEGDEADRAVRAIFRRLWTEGARRRPEAPEEEKLTVQVARRWLLDRRARARMEGGAPRGAGSAAVVSATQADLFGPAAGVARALAGLEPGERDVLERIVAGGQTVAGVSSELGVPAVEVRERARRALVRVGEALHGGARA